MGLAVAQLQSCTHFLLMFLRPSHTQKSRSTVQISAVIQGVLVGGQDFEALTPNLLARTIETVEGGGIIVLLLSSLTSLTQLYSLTMDVHHRFRTDSHQEVTGALSTTFLSPNYVALPHAWVFFSE